MDLSLEADVARVLQLITPREGSREKTGGALHKQLGLSMCRVDQNASWVFRHLASPLAVCHARIFMIDGPGPNLRNVGISFL
jgi:hypothetical protein